MDTEPLLRARSSSQCLAIKVVDENRRQRGWSLNDYESTKAFFDKTPEEICQNQSRSLLPNLKDSDQHPADLILCLEGRNGSLQNGELPGEFQVYRRRWYILAVFSVMAFMQGGLGNVWVVIAQSVEVAFGWTDSTVSLLQIWMYVTYLAGFFPFAWLIDKQGLRIAFVLSSLLLALGTLFRCLASSPPLVTWFAHLGHLLVGLSGPVAFGAGTVVSAEWFPAHQRTTSTAVATLSGFAGCALTFVFGPNIVDPPSEGGMGQNNTFGSMLELTQGQHIRNYTNINEMRQQILKCRYAEFAVCGTLFLLALVYFPARPPTPPSLSSASKKDNVVDGLKELFRRDHAQFWLLAIPYGLALGIYGTWSGLVDVILKPIGVSETEAGWLGFYSVVAGCAVGVIIGRINDLFPGHMKTFLLCLTVMEALLTFWFLLIAGGYIPFSTAGLYISFIGQGMAVNACAPLFFELSVEKMYPIAEVVTSGMMNIVYNVIPIFFLLMFLDPNIGTSWMNWCMYGGLLLSVPMILLFKEQYKRLEFDKKETRSSI